MPSAEIISSQRRKKELPSTPQRSKSKHTSKHNSQRNSKHIRKPDYRSSIKPTASPMPHARSRKNHSYTSNKHPSFAERWVDVTQQMLSDAFPCTSNKMNQNEKQLENSSDHIAPKRSKRKSNNHEQPLLYKDPTLRARVPLSVLQGGSAPIFQRNFFSRVTRSFRRKATVKVETFTSGMACSVLYAPEGFDSSPDMAYVPTTLVNGIPQKRDKNVVYQDSPFEIRASGMLVKNFDLLKDENELLMYSIQADTSDTGATNESLPYIHYHFSRDGTASTEKANTFVPIPASKAYVTGSPGVKSSSSAPKSPKTATPDDTSKDEAPFCSSCGAEKRISKPKPKRITPKPKKSVNINFRIVELDQPKEAVIDAVKGIDQLGGMVAGLAMTAPFLGVLSPALGMASAVSKHALNSYAKPDKVMSIDMDFLIANRKRVEKGTAAPGEYLRYGYYFFLSEPVEGKLYASVKTPKNVQLMLKRVAGDKKAPTDVRGHPIATKRYFPLTEVSYLVVRVCEPTGASRSNRRPIMMQHANELETLFQRAHSDENPEDIRVALKNLGKSLGVLPDSESEDGAK